MGKHTFEGTVTGLYAANQESMVGSALEHATVKIGGFEEDTRHFGIMKNSGVREPQYQKGTPIFNYRQISAVSEEELEAIANSLGITEIKPEWLGANILLRGIPNLTSLPPTSRLYFAQGPTLMVYGENTPCRFAGEQIEAHYEKERLAVGFVKAAMFQRGLVGWVEKEGSINLGDICKVEVPKYVSYNLPKKK